MLLHFYLSLFSMNIFSVTGPLCGEFTGQRWIPHTKGSDAELWCWVNNHEEGDLKRHGAHCDVSVMSDEPSTFIFQGRSLDYLMITIKI